LKFRPDFSKMSESAFEDFVQHSRLAPSARDALRAASDRQGCYADAMFWVELSDANRARTEFHNYLVEQSVFMTRELREKFSVVGNALSEALVAREVDRMYGDTNSIETSRKAIASLASLVDEILVAVHSEA